jgi:uncharacterized protein involved in exopolysaccharide biosynthesis
MYAQATLYDYWMALYSRKGFILLATLSTVAFTLLISYQLPPIYEVKATLFFPVNEAPSAYTAVSSQRIAQTALRPHPEEKEAGIHAGVLKSDDMAEKVQALFPEKDLAFFKKNVDFVTSPQFFTDIYVRDRDPELAARIANAYVELYAEFHRDALRKRATRAEAVLEPELARIRERLAQKTAEISKYKQKNRMLSSTEAEQLVSTQTQQLERDRNAVLVEVQAVQGQIAAAGLAAANVSASGANQPVIRNPLFEKERRLIARRDALTERIDKLRGTAPSTVAALSTLQKMESERRTLELLGDSVELNLAEARMQTAAPLVDIVRVQTARPPSTPSFPIHALNGFVALILGFGAACYAALLLSYLGRLRVERIKRRLLADGVLDEVTP